MLTASNAGPFSTPGREVPTLTLLHVHPQRTEIRRIEMMISDVTKRVQLYIVNVSSVTSDFTFKTEVTKVDRKELLAVENPRYQEMINKYPHLKGVHIDDRDAKERRPIHLIVGANDSAAIKIDKAPRVGRPGEPIAESTRLGWTVMYDYEHLCRLDVLGLEDRPPGDQDTVHAEFKEQLKRSKEGWYPRYSTTRLEA